MRTGQRINDKPATPPCKAVFFGKKRGYEEFNRSLTKSANTQSLFASKSYLEKKKMHFIRHMYDNNIIFNNINRIYGKNSANCGKVKTLWKKV